MRKTKRKSNGLNVESLESRRLMACDVMPGDANGDCHFDEADVIQVFKAGSYNLNVEADWESGDWDGAIGTNTPGQSGDPSSPYYRNTFDTWAKNQYFPIYYSREKIESVMADKIVLIPGQ